MALTGQLQSLGVRAIGQEAHVVDVSSVSPSVVRVRATSRRVHDGTFLPGHKIKVHVGGGQMRSYTPVVVDASEGVFELVVFAQGESAASRWVRGLRPDSALHFFGPARSVTGPSGDEPWIGFYGDETALGLAESILGAAPTNVCIGALETRPEDIDAVAHLPLQAVPRGAEVGARLVEHARHVGLPPGLGVFWLSGEATTVIAVRAALLERGVAKAQLRTKPYWSVRGKAHRKMLEQTELR